MIASKPLNECVTRNDQGQQQGWVSANENRHISAAPYLHQRSAAGYGVLHGNAGVHLVCVRHYRRIATACGGETVLSYLNTTMGALGLPKASSLKEPYDMETESLRPHPNHVDTTRTECGLLAMDRQKEGEQHIQGARVRTGMGVDEPV